MKSLRKKYETKIPKKNKYGAKKVVIDGIKFDSTAEGDFYLILKHQERQGLVKILEMQPKVYLTDARILYKADFKIQRKEEIVFIDVKGMVTATFAIKARLWKHYTNATLEVVSKKGRNFETTKIIKGNNSTTVLK